MKPVHSLSDDELSQQLQRALRALPDVPPALQRAAIGLWPGAGLAPTVAARLGGWLNHIRAVLSFDSWAAPALAPGMRSLRSSTRHLLFAAQGRDIDLRIAPDGSSFSLAGQILGPDESGTLALTRLDLAGSAALAATLDGLGEFRIEAVPPGLYQLSLQLGPDLIELPALQVGEPAPGPSVDLGPHDPGR